MFNQFAMLWEARSLMKKNEPFLPTWHAYVGYKLNLFHKLAQGETLSNIVQREQYDENLMRCWIDVGLTVGHLKQRGNTLIPSKRMLKYFSSNSPYCVGELSREMLEMHIPSLISYPDLIQGQEKKPYYGDIYGQTVADTSALIAKRAFSTVCHALKKHHVSSILDIGCGTGGYLLKLALRNKAGSYTGIDINEAVISKAQAAASRLSLANNVQFIHTSIENWDTNGQCYDAIMLNNLLHYYSPESRLELLRQAKELLNTNGIIVIVTPLYLEKGGQRFSAAFNAFMNAHSNLYPLPRKQEILDDAKQLGLSFDSMKTIIREGSWYLICLQNNC